MSNESDGDSANLTPGMPTLVGGSSSLLSGIFRVKRIVIARGVESPYYLSDQEKAYHVNVNVAISGCSMMRTKEGGMD